MTYADDMCFFQMLNSRQHGVSCKDLGVRWPPPLRVIYMGFPYKLANRSYISDEQRKVMTNVFRGAVYVLDDGNPAAASHSAVGRQAGP